MKCPHCGAWSDVLETRTKDDWVTKRRRRCANDHRFNTYEVLETVWQHGRHRHKVAVKTVLSRIKLWLRNQRIRAELAAGHKGVDVAARHGISPDLVSLIKRSKA